MEVSVPQQRSWFRADGRERKARTIEAALDEDMSEVERDVDVVWIHGKSVGLVTDDGGQLRDKGKQLGMSG
jgi:hypothetical protein